jgi:Protein of unknown function (DUF732)
MARNIMWRLVLGGAIASVLAVACSTDDSTTIEDSPARPTTVVVAGPEADEFASHLRSEGIFLDVRDSVLIETGRRVCGQFDSGDTFHEIVSDATQEPLLAERAREVGFLIGAATMTFCPRHIDEVPRG